MSATTSHWEYASLKVVTMKDNPVVTSINGHLQDFVNSPASPFDVLNEMGQEGWELVNILTLLPPSANALNPRGVWEYILKRPS